MGIRRVNILSFCMGDPIRFIWRGGVKNKIISSITYKLDKIRGVVGLQGTWIKSKFGIYIKNFAEALKYFNSKLFGEF